MLKYVSVLLFITGIIFSCGEATREQVLIMPQIFGDHMVLQRDRDIAVWGWAQPGREVRIQFRQQEMSVKAGSDSRWRAALRPEPAGGPDSLLVECNQNRVVFRDVMIGEVWLCSGQSNMEMPLLGFPPGDPIRNSDEEIENARYPEMRLFTVKRTVAFEPVHNCTGQWQQCTPPVARNFSATAYFFGREIYRELQVPVGLIVSSWGGTPAEAWTGHEFLSKLSDFDSVLQNIEASKIKVRERMDWLDRVDKRTVEEIGEDKWSRLNLNDVRVAERDYDDHEWKTMQLPVNWEATDVDQFDGVMWFRKKIDLTESMLNQNLVIELGPIDDMDITYFNGVKVGETMKEGLWKQNRVYEIPAGLVTERENVIAVRVLDHQGGGGIYGDPDLMKLYVKGDAEEQIPLSGLWYYLPVAEYQSGIFYLFDIESQQFYDRPDLPAVLGPRTPTTLYNGMISPLVPYTIRGVIWYQGESNTGNPDQYTYLFPAMIANWRKVWGQGDFPFYFVQIAPYNYSEGTASYALRDAQRKSLSVPNTGMAVILDIGNPQNIHPANKQDVGKRLALWALARTYGRDIVYSGPLYKGMKTAGHRIILSFDHMDGGLVLKDLKPGDFLIAGADRRFRQAEVEISGEILEVSSPEIGTPVSVRYLWDNTSAASLFNKAGLPASSFRTDDWVD